MAHPLETKHTINVFPLLLAFVLVFSSGSPIMAQQCKGPNLTLSVTDMGGERTRLTCAYIGSNLSYILSCRTEGGSDLQVNLEKIKKISVLRDKKGRLIRDADEAYLLATVYLKDGNSRKLYINGLAVVGYSSWGKQSFDPDKIKTIDFE